MAYLYGIFLTLLPGNWEGVATVAGLAQSVERETLIAAARNLKVVGSTPTFGWQFWPPHLHLST
jgi:hypothetical protein